MNSFIRMEIMTQITSCRNFLEACGRDALKDDGQVDKTEKKQLKSLEKATKRYVKELNKLLK